MKTLETPRFPASWSSTICVALMSAEHTVHILLRLWYSHEWEYVPVQHHRWNSSLVARRPSTARITTSCPSAQSRWKFNSSLVDISASWTVYVWASVFLGLGSRQDEYNTKPLGIGKIVLRMPRIPSGNLDVWHRGWIRVQRVCVFETEIESVSYSYYLPLSLFLLRPEPAVSTHGTRIMGQLFGKAYYGMRRQHTSLPHAQTHTNTETVTTFQVIGIRLFQCYQSRMRWGCGFLACLSGQVFSSL